MFELTDIHKRYNLSELEVEVLQDISFSVDKGELISIMGASGSGKSTLMNIIGMLDTPTEGSYKFGDTDILAADTDTLARLRNRNIGFVFQSFHLLPRLTALQNIALPLLYRGMSRQKGISHATAMLEKVNLSSRGNHKPNELSGGQRQRVAIARALVGSPRLILADEPTGALDTHTGHDIMDLFMNLNRDEGITIIIVTHDPLIAAQCHRRLLIEDGRLGSDSGTFKHRVDKN